MRTIAKCCSRPGRNPPLVEGAGDDGFLHSASLQTISAVAPFDSAEGFRLRCRGRAGGDGRSDGRRLELAARQDNDRLDTAAHFYPVYAFLGERLRSGDIPGWNPHQFAGVPFAADHETGWMYLPAMLFFTILPLDKAAEASIVFHFLLAGLSTYALARVLGMGVAGASTAAVAYASVGFLTERSVCCLVHVQVAAWLPVLLVGAELAIRNRT